MAAHDAVPHETIGLGTILYRCEARPGDVVVIHASGRFRAARVTRLGPKRVYTIYPAANPDERPHQPARPKAHVYALVGTEVAGVIRPVAWAHDRHYLARAAHAQHRSREGGGRS